MAIDQVDKPPQSPATAFSAGRDAIYPRVFSVARSPGSPDAYLDEPLVRRAVDFFEIKGLSALKHEDRLEQWYQDWIEYQAGHRLYARLLIPRRYCRLDSDFDLLRYARFLEVCGYFSPAHGYSLQVTFLGLCSILMGANETLKRQAVEALDAGGLLAFGVSERHHGSDLLSNEFIVAEAGPGELVANGAKYYIGNSNSASIISVLAKKQPRGRTPDSRRAPLVLFALRPALSEGFRNIRKIHTLGARAAFVGEFGLKDHRLCEDDLVAEGRQAWDAVFGAVTLGKFFLGFGSIGICEHAFQEAAEHLTGRVLYGKPAIRMPHLQATMVQAFARLTAMKLYAYRALDYVHAGSRADRRYVLFAAVQKAKVSTEGVKVMALLSECMGAKGFEADTYFEMALRDIQLIPGLEGSTHINLGLALQSLTAYFSGNGQVLPEPGSLVAGETPDRENPRLFDVGSSAVNVVAFPNFLTAYRALMATENVGLFADGAEAFERFVRDRDMSRAARPDSPETLALGQCLTTIVYGQLVAEAAVRFSVPTEIVAAIFHGLVIDLRIAAMTLQSWSTTSARGAAFFRSLKSAPRLSDDACAFVSKCLNQADDPLRRTG